MSGILCLNLKEVEQHYSRRMASSSTVECVPLSRKVAVIGAGAAGIATAAALKERSHQPVILEQAMEVGGTWRYEEDEGISVDDKKDSQEIYSVQERDGLIWRSSMYDALITNLSKQVMQFSDFSFPEDLPDFPHRRDVLRYLQEYAKFKGVGEDIPIKLGTRVQQVKRVGKKWIILMTSESEKELQMEFDAVCVCSGHFSVPYYPKIQGLEDFANWHNTKNSAIKVIHSHFYRNPRRLLKEIKGKSILILGGGFSALDIGSELREFDPGLTIRTSLKDDYKLDKFENEVFRSRLIASGRDYNWIMKASNRRPTIHSINLKSGEIEFVANLNENPKRETYDLLLLCSGYVYNFPFLSGSEEILVTGEESKKIPSLIQHVFPEKFLVCGSLSFIGIPWSVNPFPLCEIQAHWVGHVLANGNGVGEIPEEEIRPRSNTPDRYWHREDHCEYVEWIIRRFGGQEMFKSFPDRSLRRCSELKMN